MERTRPGSQSGRANGPYHVSISPSACFNAGGTGARANKDGLNTTGFPSGVAGVPAEVIERLAPLIQYRRELRTDSGGPGTYRGGLGQWTEVGYRGDVPWAVSAMIDRARFPATGLNGAAAAR